MCVSVWVGVCVSKRAISGKKSVGRKVKVSVCVGVSVRVKGV